MEKHLCRRKNCGRHGCIARVRATIRYASRPHNSIFISPNVKLLMLRTATSSRTRIVVISLKTLGLTSKRPGCGHDFLSHSADDVQRYIEVKCVAKLNGGYRFFLSANERQTSLWAEHCGGYFFYLVFFDGSSNPVELLAIRADQLYPKAELLPSSYEVRFHRTKF